MSGDRYFITDQHATYFLTFTVVEWIDIFTRPEYKQVIVDSLNYCIAEKGLECYGWVLMTNHMHLIVRAIPPATLSGIIRDYKKFTSKKLLEIIQTIPESRRDWLLRKFGYWANSTGRAENYKLWTDDNHAINLDNSNLFKQKLDYIHENPVRQQIVAYAQDYIFSSASDYAGKKGLVDIIID
ncbi:MAG: transposase [Bacteroidetes bacterium 43-93]|nr:transposase [Bacteroidota bacterium]OJW95609.1 MAG: transposase [Bacteroidetes bacterium 43-93]